MDLEELKTIWDSQTGEPLYFLNESGLHAIVRRRNLEITRCAACRYSTEITIGLVCGIVMLAGAGLLGFGQTWLATLPWPKVAPTVWDSAALLVAAVVWFYFAAYMSRARNHQQQCGEAFESTLRGDIERALIQTEFQIKVARGILWRGFIPVWVAAALWVVTLFRLTDALAWTYVFMASVMAGALVMSVSGQHRAIRERYEPHQRELESLRRKLADSEI